MPRVTDVAIERSDGATRTAGRDHVVVEAPLQIRAHGVPVATIMRTPGHDLELVRGLLHAESIGACAMAQDGDDGVELDTDAAAFERRGLLATAACGVCGRAAIADLESRATSVDSDRGTTLAVIATLPEKLRAAQELFDDTGGLHAAALFTLAGERVAVREDVGRHNAVDKLVGWALGEGVDKAGLVDPASHLLFLSGRAGYELVQKAIMFRVPIVASVSAPSSLAIELAERFNVSLVGFVRGNRANVYAHGWRLR
ncbi:MAG TPA: formate dehydrogenase accessory sulfurtransferase FdhD [Kofleriaceae bacterium]|nr:formate dehydrogenase accessory sulfurtransferase FdhD [Kofleriaceae bacterium]